MIHLKSISNQDIPTHAQWLSRQEVQADLTAQKLGVDRDRLVWGHVGASKILDILGADGVAEFTAVKIPGQVVWCNFELARELGFAVPPSNRMTPEFHEQLIDAFSYQVLPSGEEAGDRKIMTMYADRYGGDLIGYNLGAGRSGFLPYGNLYIKGIGLTPLFHLGDPKDWMHIHGGHLLDEALSEAVFGEVNANLFTQGSARVLAIIDQGQVIRYARRRLPSALVVRAGRQYRPAHLLAKAVNRDRSRLDIFIRMTRETGQLVTRPGVVTGEEIPDLKATMLRIVDDHARTAAEQVRWRIAHCALSSSNMEMSGAMLDLDAQTAQPRTAPIHILKVLDSVFGREHVDRAAQLGSTYRAVLKNMPDGQRQWLNAKSMNLKEKMNKAYKNHLQVVLLRAVGLKTELAERIRTDHADLARRFTELAMNMAELKNPVCLNAARSVCEFGSVLDVFHLFQNFPRKYFEAPTADHTEAIRADLKPIFRGNRFHMAKKQAVVERLIGQFDNLYRELMSACESLAEEYYGDIAGMQASIIWRAAFENESLSRLYFRQLRAEWAEAIAAYKTTGDVATLRDAIDERISASLRNVDALLAQGRSRHLPDGGVEVQMQIIDGIRYSIRAWDDQEQTRRLHISIPVAREGSHCVIPLHGQLRLTRRQLQSLRYHFTINRWVNSGDVGMHPELDEQGCALISTSISPLPWVGRLEGDFYIKGSSDFDLRDETSDSGGYAFAVPDQQELRKLIGTTMIESPQPGTASEVDYALVDG
jgi:hypothetical protein